MIRTLPFLICDIFPFVPEGKIVCNFKNLREKNILNEFSLLNM